VAHSVRGKSSEPLNQPIDDLYRRLASDPCLRLVLNVPLRAYTRFALGGPVDLLLETGTASSLESALSMIEELAIPFFVLGGGTNLIVSDQGYRGVVVRWNASSLKADPAGIFVESGLSLQSLIDTTVDRALSGLESLAGIPGTVGGAIYGNAGAYGHAIGERVAEVVFLDAQGIRKFSGSACRFSYRHSRFKDAENGVILGVRLALAEGNRQRICEEVEDIRRVRREKFPDDMRCAGSIFKNLLLQDVSREVVADIPPAVVREGKVPAAWFLEQVGAKGDTRGGIRVADHHANLIYNRGDATAMDLYLLLQDLKRRVYDRFGLLLEEEVRYLGAFS